MKTSILLLLFLSLKLYSQEIKLTILHTNDHHGQYMQDSQGQYGMAARKTLVDQIRAEVSQSGGHLLLLSGGDINTGRPESDLLDAEPDFIGMNMIGYHAMALGNHEFDKPYHVLLKQQKLAKFPFLAANIYDRKSGLRAFKPFQIFEFGGLKIGVVGFTTEDTQKFTQVKEVTFRPILSEAQKIIPGLRKQVDFVIAVTHIGHYANGNHGINAPGDVKLARATKGMIDVIVGGHTQVPLFKPDKVGKTLILQAHEWGKYVGRLDLIVNKNQNRVVSYELIPVNHKDKAKKFAQDTKLKNILSSFNSKVEQKLSQVVGQSDGAFLGRAEANRIKGETNLGRLVAHSMCYLTKSDVCFTNNGGLRTDLRAGRITVRDILSILPFGNHICTFKLNDVQISRYLKSLLPIHLQNPIHFMGAKIGYKKNRIVEIGIFKNGHLVPVLKNGVSVAKGQHSFKIGTSCYLSTGKDGFPNMSKFPGHVDTGYKDAYAFRSLIEKNKVLRVNDYISQNIFSLSN